MTRRLIILILIAEVMVSCDKDPKIPPTLTSDLDIVLLTVPEGFEEIPFPEDNAFSVEKWKLGKKLFYDVNLSRDRSISCGSCHKADLAFSDDLAVSPGVENRLGERNSPSLANVAYFPYFMREGGVPNLEMQILVPIQEHAEFDFNILELAERLREDTTYVGMAGRAFDREVDAWVITRAIATFERTLISGNSRYDQHERKGNVFDAAEERGMELFFSARTSCSECHGGLFFTDHSFQNNGLYSDYKDPGRYRLTADSADVHLFKVPSLRNVALSAPYMHDGGLSSLREVIEHYNTGGRDHPQKNELIRPLELTDKEIDDLISFLDALTDDSFTQSKHFRDE